jgi:starch synthase
LSFPQILSVASELFPLIKTGGLADVTGALPGALARESIAVRSLLPGYPGVCAALAAAETIYHWPALFGGPARLLAGRAHDLDLLVLEAPHLYARPGNPYTGPDGQDWPDNAQRFAALGRAAADLGLGKVAAYRPDIVHGHDWQAGLTHAYLAYEASPGKRAGRVMTIHNLAFQGQFPTSLLRALGLPDNALSMAGVEYYDSIGYLKAGLYFADRITTVSPSYATEIRTREGGMGMDGLLRARADTLSGIANGIDTDVWNPGTDPAIPAQYSSRSLGRRARNKAALQARFGLAPDQGALLFAVISRLTAQKGIDLLIQAIPALLAEGAQLAVLGTGDVGQQAALLAAAQAHAGRIGAVIGYDETLAHLMQAGADALLVPSRFEPCGLTQLCALRYGTIPVVSKVGGLADTVADGRTGFQFWPVTQAGLIRAVNRAATCYQDKPEWQRLQRQAMATDVSWAAAARQYATLYRGISQVMA